MLKGRQVLPPLCTITTAAAAAPAAAHQQQQQQDFPQQILRNV